MKLLSSYKT